MEQSIERKEKKKKRSNCAPEEMQNFIENRMSRERERENGEAESFRNGINYRISGSIFRERFLVASFRGFSLELRRMLLAPS